MANIYPPKYGYSAADRREDLCARHLPRATKYKVMATSIMILRCQTTGTAHVREVAQAKLFQAHRRWACIFSVRIKTEP